MELNGNTPHQPEASEITLQFNRNTELGLSAFLVVIPDSRLEGMKGINLKEVLPNVWNSSRTSAHRISLLSQGVAMIEAYNPLGGPPPVAPVRKPNLSERVGRFLVKFFTRRSKK